MENSRFRKANLYRTSISGGFRLVISDNVETHNVWRKMISDLESFSQRLQLLSGYFVLPTKQTQNPMKVYVDSLLFFL